MRPFFVCLSFVFILFSIHWTVTAMMMMMTTTTSSMVMSMKRKKEEGRSIKAEGNSFHMTISVTDRIWGVFFNEGCQRVLSQNKNNEIKREKR